MNLVFSPWPVAHLQRRLDAGRTIVGVETARERLRRQADKPLGQFDHRLVREAGHHHVLDLFQLVRDGGIDVRVGVPEQVHPP
jgi:hypothetical protein